MIIRRFLAATASPSSPGGRQKSSQALPPVSSCQLGAKLNRVLTEPPSLTDNATYASLLRWCGRAKSLPPGRSLHAHLVRGGLDGGSFLANLLLQMYGQCGKPHLARALFDGIHCPDTFSWNHMISAYAQNGHPWHALRLFSQMVSAGETPNKFTFLSVISVVGSLRALTEAKQIHDRVMSDESFRSDITLRTALLSMHGKCGSVMEAESIFDTMCEKDVVSWTSMMTAYAQNGHGWKALALFKKMELEGVKPDRVTFLSLLDACASLASLENGRLIHIHANASGAEADTAVKTALLTMYGKCGSLKEARAVFNEVQKPGVVSWNAMITVYAQSGFNEEALEHLKLMDLNGVNPDRVTFLSTLEACANLASRENGRKVHERIIACGLDTDIALNNALISMYGKCSSLEDARKVFNGMPFRDVISWTAIIAVHTENGHSKEALGLFRQMDLEGIKPNRITFLGVLDAIADLCYLEEGRLIHDQIAAMGFEADIAIQNAIINMYGKCGSLRDARAVFDDARQCDTITWTSMIAAYAHNGLGKEALGLFDKMLEEGLKPDAVAFLIALDACTRVRSLEMCRAMHERVRTHGLESDLTLGNALLSMYGKCGGFVEAKALFESMPRRDWISWNAMITACVQNGHNKDALELFDRMDQEGVKQDRATFVSTLEACADLASLENGRTVHKCIIRNGLESDVAVKNALMNMYGKCGSLKDAQEAFDGISSQQDALSWNSIITVYAQNGHTHKALELFTRMDFEGVKPNHITFLSVLNACSYAGMQDEAWRIFVSMGVDYGILSSLEHYVCMVDLLGRAGDLSEAEDLIRGMPVPSDAVTWTALLSSCQLHGDTERGILAAQCILALEPNNAAVYVLLSNVFAAAGRLSDARKLQMIMEERGISPGLRLMASAHV